ncbi:MAG: SIMPL domain-containing protein [Candidatus Bathyarchaeia archaeon]
MGFREKHFYGIIIVLAVALAGVGGYLVAIVQYGQHSEPKVYPIIAGETDLKNQLRTITVSCSGRASARPNQVELSLGVVTEATTAAEALVKNAESMNRVIRALKDMGIFEENIETSRFNLYPKYSSVGVAIIGFEVTHMLKVTTTNLDEVGRLIDGAIEAGANRVEGVYFTFTKDKFEELNVLARQRAVEDARAKAETIAKSLGVKITGVASATEDTYYAYSRAEYAYSVAPVPTPIMPPTEMEITITVRVTYIIE